MVTVASGKVVGQFGFGITDGSDVGEDPDIVYASGTVTLTPNLTSAVVVEGTPNKMIMWMTPITFILDSQGYLCTPLPANPELPGTRGGRVPANDDPNIGVSEWNYTVSVRLTSQDGAWVGSMEPFQVFVPAGAGDGVVPTVDLANFSPLPVSSGDPVLIGQLVTSVANAVPKSDLIFNARDFGSTGTNSINDAIGVQAAADAAAAAGGGEVLIGPGGNYRFDTTVTVPSNVTVRGAQSLISITGARPAFTVAAGTENPMFSNLKFMGTLPVGDVSISANQVGIKAYAAWDNLITGLEIQGCTFDRISGTAIQMKHVSDFTIRLNKIRKHGYAAIGGHSVHDGLIEGNRILGTGKLPSYVANSYGIYCSTLEADGLVGTTQNPRSSDVMIRNNQVKNQVWSCLDTHVGERISFIGNNIIDCPASAINAVYISTTVGDPDAQLAPKDILIEGNTITYTSVTAAAGSGMNMAILLRGSISTDTPTTRERATGVIRGNIIRRYGEQDTSNSGAIFVASSLGVVVEGNSMHECRAIGVHMRDSLGGIITGNTFIDLWRSTGTATAVFLALTQDAAMDVTVTGNKFVRGYLSEALGLPVGAVVNNSGINGTNSPAITVMEGNNEWGTATFASTQTRCQVGTGRLRRMTGTAAPTTGTWLQGEQVVNGAPAAAGYLGWVCTTGGTPGVWKGYGLIQA